ncbi:metal ABC transporter solute-binding protein, Zn/Mn family [Allopusillimonas ginsengisoli]|uniref:metal ABC transporter solute-binding protein, Zn/Mn family n=1 Tax=Allopusillimonas ginsengisoli TaxID=453575 RepID=UPI0010223445|nr:zinc ABC transporter substrate-binding protein [Allopusillimonas ginsengisoli]TEA74278.1 manganese transporter [Allopusillimonas ginsengisoli]
MNTVRRHFLQYFSGAALAFLLVTTHLPASGGTPLSKPLKVVTTTAMLADAVQHVGGARVEVTALMGAGVDPHLYRQTHADVTRLKRADLVIYHGLHLEAQLASLMQDLARHKPVVALAEALPRQALLADEDHPEFYDPHVWMDPSLWQEVVLAARDTLIDQDPAGRQVYTARAATYINEINTANTRITTLLHSIPAPDRVLVTAHDAFRYFGRAYGYEVLSIQGISTESEASLHQIEQLVDTLVQRRIPAVFVESSVPEQHVRALTEGARARHHHLIIGGELYSDAMGRPGTPEGTYIGMIEHNARTISQALSRS